MMRLRRCIELLTVLALFGQQQSPAQSGTSQSGPSTPSQEPDWVGSYSSGLVQGINEAVTARSDKDGNLYVGGSGGTLLTGTDYVLCKYDLSGRLLWTARYNGPDNADEQLTALAVDDSGNACVTGYAKSAAGRYSCVTAAYDAQGRTRWTATFKTPDERGDFGRHLAIAPGGAVYVLEENENTQYFPQTVANLVKYAPGGQQLWVASFASVLPSTDSIAMDQPADLIVDKGANVYILLWSTIGVHSSNTNFMTVVKFDPVGRQQWTLRISSPDRDYTDPIGLAFDPSGHIVVCGLGNTYQVNHPEVIVMKCDTSGQLLKLTLLKDAAHGSSMVSAFAVDPSGNTLIVGTDEDTLFTHINARITKLAPDGGLVWTILSAQPLSRPTSVSTDSFGRLIMAGTVGNEPQERFFASVYDQQGTELWSRAYDADSARNNHLQALVPGPGGVVRLVGTTFFYGQPPFQGWRDFTTVQYGWEGSLQWVQRYNGFGYSLDQAVDVTLDGAGRTVILGSAQGSAQDRDFLVAVFEKGGSFLWAHQLDGGLHQNEVPARVQCDGANNIIITGTSLTSLTTSDVLTAKYSSSGDLLWQARVPHAGTLYTPSGALAVDSTGEAFVGVPFPTAAGFTSWKVVKYSPAGAEVWSAQEAASTSRTFRSIALAVDPQGYLYVGGGIGDSAFIAKFTLGGRLEWEAYFALPGVGCAILALTLDLQGNVLAAGATVQSGGRDGYLILKFSSSGVRQWAVDERSLTVGHASSVYADGSGSVYVGGTPLLMKYSSGGERLWFAGEPAGFAVGSGARPGIDAAQTMYNIEGTGSTYQHHDVITNAVNSAGILFWSDRYSEPPSVLPAALAVNPAGDVRVAATASYPAGLYSTALRVIAYSKVATAVRPHSALPDRFMLGQNFPNPFNPTTVIPFTLPRRAYVTLAVFNMLGQRVAELVDRTVEAGYHEVRFDAGTLAAGVYFYRLQAGSSVDTKKLLLVH